MAPQASKGGSWALPHAQPSVDGARPRWRGQAPRHAGVTQPSQSLSSTRRKVTGFQVGKLGDIRVTKSSADMTSSALSFVKRQNQDMRKEKKGSKWNTNSHGWKQGVRQGHWTACPLLCVTWQCLAGVKVPLTLSEAGHSLGQAQGSGGKV